MNSESKAYQEGYQIGLDGREDNNPYPFRSEEECVDYRQGYSDGWRDFNNWVNLMCN